MTRSQSKRRHDDEQNGVHVEGKSDPKKDKRDEEREKTLSPIASVPTSQYSSPVNIEEDLMQ